MVEPHTRAPEQQLLANNKLGGERFNEVTSHTTVVNKSTGFRDRKRSCKFRRCRWPARRLESDAFFSALDSHGIFATRGVVAELASVVGTIDEIGRCTI